MVIFDRKNLIESQNSRLNRLYKDINFFVWLGWIIVTIVSFVVIYFFSILIGLWIEAIVVFSCSIYYLIMSFVRERMYLGYYQKAKKLQVDLFAEGVAIKEFTRDNQVDYLVGYNQIFKIVEYKHYFVIFLKNEGRITLPNLQKADVLKEQLKSNLSGRYFVYEE